MQQFRKSVVRRLPTWLLIALVGGVALAATVDALLLNDSDGSAPEATGVRDPSAGAEATTRTLPRCERSQLRLVIEILKGIPTAALQHVRGGLCETENLPISITIPGGRGRVLGPSGAFSGSWSPNSQHIAQFRYSPACNERGPFLAVVRAGPYTAQQRIPALRCGL
jgi:hypothetical protein